MARFFVPYRMTCTGEALVEADTAEEAESYVEEGDFIPDEHEEIVGVEVTGNAYEDL